MSCSTLARLLNDASGDYAREKARAGEAPRLGSIAAALPLHVRPCRSSIFAGTSLTKCASARDWAVPAVPEPLVPPRKVSVLEPTRSADHTTLANATACTRGMSELEKSRWQDLKAAAAAAVPHMVRHPYAIRTPLHSSKSWHGEAAANANMEL